MSVKRVLVIGYGFIGSHVVDWLLRRGYDVSIMERKVNSLLLRPAMVKDTNLILGDVRDREAVFEACEGHDGVINLSGILGTQETIMNPHESVDTNVHGALNVFEACSPSTKYPNGIPVVQIAVGNHWMDNTYSITKNMAERFASMFNKYRGGRITVVRALNAYGPRQKHAPVRKIVPSFIVRALNGKPIEVYGDGTQVMDMVWVGDVADVLCKALLMNHGCRDHVFEVGTGRRTNVNEIAHLINGITGNVGGIKHLKMRSGEPENSVVLGDPTTLRPLGMDGDDLKSIDHGLVETVRWYREHYDWLGKA